MVLQPLKIHSKEVHIWPASLLNYANNIEYFYSLLSEDERERAGNFKFFKDKRQFTIIRGILRCLLSSYVGQPPESIEIMYGLWGKPYLPEDQCLYFNVSHSGDYALYAVTPSHEVGVDLEYIDKNFELEDMALHIFSTSELADWKALDSEERVNAFFTRWVSREAFLKASGKGWLEDKKKLTFYTKNVSGKKILNDEAFNLHCFKCIPGYASALFVEGNFLPSLIFWNQSSLRSFLKNHIRY